MPALELERVFTADLGRDVYLRPGTRDSQVWADTFSGRYHLPPEAMPPPRTVLDLGANIGLTASHYAKLWPDADVLAVEMDRGNADLIVENAPGVRLAVMAVSDRAGLASYESSAGSDSFALGGSLDSPTLTIARARTLRQVILRRFAGIEAAGGVDFVKMDVEGTEWSLFANPDWAPLVRHLLVELHGEGSSAELVARGIAALEAAGFHAEHHERHRQAVWAWR